MKKTLISLTLLTVLVLVSLKLFAALLTYQALEAVRTKYAEDVAFTYSWLSSDLTGSIEIKDLHLTSFILKRTIDAESATIYFDNIIQLFYGLIDLKEGKWQSVRRIVLSPARAAIEGRDPELWLAAEIDPLFGQALALYGCGKHSRVGVEELNGMGIDSLTGALDVHFVSPTKVELNLDSNQLGRWSLSLEKTADQDFTLSAVGQWVLQRVELSYVESGYFRRLSNFCSAQTQVDREEFARDAARHWRLAMARAGVLMGAEIEQAYAKFLALGGQLNLTLAPEKALTVGGLKSVRNENLAKLLGVQINLNGDVIKDPQIYWSKSAPKVERKAPELKKSTENKAQALTKQWTELALVPENLASHIGYPLRITTLDGKDTEARLLAVTERGLEVARRVQGGEVSYFVKHEDIIRLEVYR